MPARRRLPPNPSRLNRLRETSNRGARLGYRDTGTRPTRTPVRRDRPRPPLHRRRVGRAGRLGDDRGDRLDHRAGDRADPRGNPRGRRSGRAGRSGRFRDLAGGAGRATRRRVHGDQRRAGRARRRDRDSDRGGGWRNAVWAGEDHSGGAAGDGLRIDGAGGERAPLGGADRELADRARAGRGGRVHHPLELSASPDLRQGRAGADRRLLGGREAQRGDAAHLLRPRRDHGLARAAGRRLQPRHRLWAGGRRGDRGARGRGHGLLHRVDACRAAGGPGGRGHRQAGGARARREVRQRDPRRRRSAEGGRLRGRQLLPELGTDLQRAHPDAGAAGEARGGRGGCPGGGREGSAWRSLRGRDAPWAARLRRTA